MMKFLNYSLSLSLSLSLREYRSINKKFHKTSKIKNIRIMFLKSYLSRGGAATGLDLSRAEAVGSGRACQRPSTSSGAKCFSCEGALVRDTAFFKFLAIIVAPGGAGLSDEQREEMTNREGVAAGGATINSHLTINFNY